MLKYIIYNLNMEEKMAADDTLIVGIRSKRGVINSILWIFQVLLALLYLNSGSLKVFQSIEYLSGRIFWITSVPEVLVRIIGICELLGAIGLILPAAIKVLPRLTTFAAIGITILMLLANIFHILRGELFVLPLTGILLLLTVLVAYGRLKIVPFNDKLYKRMRVCGNPRPE
jgi:uncharacterized membrane protein YphA (DoxX/SURF4 family)